MKRCMRCGGVAVRQYADGQYCTACLEREKRRNMACFWEQAAKTIESRERRKHAPMMGEREMSTVKSKRDTLTDIGANIAARRAHHALAMVEG